MSTYIKNKFNKLKLKIFESAHFLYEILIKPKSKNEDHKRREFILNILLICSLLIYISSLFISLYCNLTLDRCDGQNNSTILFIFIIFLILYLISRLKSYILSAYLFILIFLIPIFYATYIWGADLSAALLFSVLLIIMSSILISTRFSFFITLVISTAFIYLTNLQINNIITPDRGWKNGKTIEPENISIYIILFLIITIISWLSNREIEKSLERARKSEAELKKERDLLEIKVKERTKELQKAQIEKMKEVSRLAEFGRLSSGLFHDLVNPLTALSFNIEKIKQIQNNYQFKEIEEDLNKAFRVTEKMRDFINSVRKQISHQENKKLFSLNQEINDVKQVLAYRARKNNININLKSSEEIKTIGNPIKFNQIILNLISNAIDIYPMDKNQKNIDVNLVKNKNTITLSVKDFGHGIPKEIQNKIFQEFFTTKKDGTGIGLPLIKNIIEKDFKGKISFKTKENKGTIFIIKFNLNKS